VTGGAVDEAPLAEAYRAAREAALALRSLGRSARNVWGLQHSEGADHLEWWPVAMVASWGPIGVAIADDEASRVALAGAAFAYFTDTLGAAFHGGWDFFERGAPARAAATELSRAAARIRAGLVEIAAGVDLLRQAADRPGASPAYRDEVARLGRRVHAALWNGSGDRPGPTPEGAADEAAMFLHRVVRTLFDPAVVLPLDDQARAVPPAGNGQSDPWVAGPRRALIRRLGALASAAGFATSIGRECADLSPFHALLAGVWGHLAGLVEVSGAAAVAREADGAGPAVLDARAANKASEAIGAAGLDRAPAHRLVRAALKNDEAASTA
jgi:hypothetical protein